MSLTNHGTHILLLTGNPGIGKTTLLCRVSEQVRDLSMSGFYTQELRESGQRTGFRLITFTGREGIIAHVDFDHHWQVGKYGVDVPAIDRFAESTLTLNEAIDLYFVDEIGKMECLSNRFIDHMRLLLSTDKIVIATLSKTGGGLIAQTKQWPHSEVWEVNKANRDAMVTQVISWLKERVHLT
ncbi:MAG: nucleoside-triphosphatase [Chromatiales bacterium]|jgi:nucleoside-triphosphatase